MARLRGVEADAVLSRVCTVPSWLVRRKRVPHALQRSGLDAGPLRH